MSRSSTWFLWYVRGWVVYVWACVGRVYGVYGRGREGGRASLLLYETAPPRHFISPSLPPSSCMESHSLILSFLFCIPPFLAGGLHGLHGRLHPGGAREHSQHHHSLGVR